MGPNRGSAGGRFNIRIDQATSHGSAHSSLSDEEDSSGTGVQVSPPSATGSHDYQDPYDVGGSWAHLSYPDELNPSDSASRSVRHRTAEAARPRPSRRQSAQVPQHRHRGEERESQPNRSRRQRRQPSAPPPPPPPQRAATPDSVATDDEEDEDDEEFLEYPPVPSDRRFWPPTAPHAPQPGYTHSTSSDPTYPPYHAGYPPNTHSKMPSNQLVQLGPGGHQGRMGYPPQSPHHPMGQYQPGVGSPGPYPYMPPFPPGQHPHGMPPGYFQGHDPRRPRHHPNPPHHPHGPPPPHHPHAKGSHGRRPPRGRDGDDDDGEDDGSPPPPQLAHGVPGHGSAPFNGSPFLHHEMVPYGQHGNYFAYGQQYPGMMSPYMHPMQGVSSSPKPEKSAASDQPDAKDEAISRLEKLILDERTDREAREAAREAAIEKAAREKAEAEERAAHDKKIAEEAAAKAKEEAKVEAEKFAAEEVAKAKAAAEEATAAAVAEASAEAAAEATKAANQPPPPKQKPIKFKDAVGRKFSFPFHLCSTWQGMEELIRQAFLHVDVLGQHVADGHYDLIGPNGDIILPQVWETVVEPDWLITMHMWPIPEKPKEPDPPPPPAEGEPPVVVVDSKKPGGAINGGTYIPAAPTSLLPPLHPSQPPPYRPDDAKFPTAEICSPSDSPPPPPPPPPQEPKVDAGTSSTADGTVVVSPPTGAKKPKANPNNHPGSLAEWMTGRRAKPTKPLKVEKKPEVVQSHDNGCTVM